MDIAAARFQGSRPLEAGQMAHCQAKLRCSLSEGDKESIEIISRELVAQAKEGRQDDKSTRLATRTRTRMAGKSKAASSAKELLARDTTESDIQELRKRGLLTAQEIAKNKKHGLWKRGLFSAQGTNTGTEGTPARHEDEDGSSTDEEMQRLGHIADAESAAKEHQMHLERRKADLASEGAGAHAEAQEARVVAQPLNIAQDMEEAGKDDTRNSGSPGHCPMEIVENSDSSFDHEDGWHEEGPTFFPPGPVCKYCARGDGDHGECKYTGSSSEECGHKTVGLRESLWLLSNLRTGAYPEVKFCCSGCHPLRKEKAPAPHHAEVETEAPSTQDLLDFGNSSSDPEKECAKLGNTGKKEARMKKGTAASSALANHTPGSGHAGLGRSGFKLKAGPIPPPTTRHILIDISSSSDEERQPESQTLQGLPPPGASGGPGNAGTKPELDNDRTRRVHLALTGGDAPGAHWRDPAPVPL
jgi:hypothetical protein